MKITISAFIDFDFDQNEIREYTKNNLIKNQYFRRVFRTFRPLKFFLKKRNRKTLKYSQKKLSHRLKNTQLGADKMSYERFQFRLQ